MRNVLSLALIMMVLSFNIGCSKSTDTAPAKLSTFNVNTYAFNKLVCDPLGGGDPGSGDPNFGAGIQANLYYLRDDQPRYQSVSSYISQGTKADQHLFFSQINVPTRLFDTGFPTLAGSLIARDDGQTLFEYFAIRFTSVLGLAADDQEGTYELALLSDDGAILRIKDDNGNYVEAVNNDGDHPTQFGCTTYRLPMTHATQKLIQLDYYQGPRYHISVIPMWRKVVAGQTQDPLCGQNGNNLYFDPDHGSTPQPAYNALLSRGWKPLRAANYSLPASALFNPCQGGIAPVISNFNVEDEIDGVVHATWTTDIASTSQLRIIDMSTGVEQLTDSDNSLATAHSVFAIALKPGHQYLFQAVSISDSYGKAISSPVTLTLQ